MYRLLVAAYHGFKDVELFTRIVEAEMMSEMDADVIMIRHQKALVKADLPPFGVPTGWVDIPHLRDAINKAACDECLAMADSVLLLWDGNDRDIRYLMQRAQQEGTPLAMYVL